MSLPVRIISEGMTGVIRTASSDTVGEVVSSLDEPGRCLLLSAQDVPLMLRSRFPFRNISDFNASSSSLSLISPVVSVLNVFFRWIWSSFLETDSSPFYL